MSSLEQLTRQAVEFYPLSSGGHAKIYSMKFKGNELIVKKGISNQDQQDLKKEAEVLAQLSGAKHVVHLVDNGVSIIKEAMANHEITNQQGAAIEDLSLGINDANSIVLEKIDGFQLDFAFRLLEESFSLGFINHQQYFNAFLFLIQDMLAGLIEIKQQHIVHGDIKPNNILFDKAKKHVVFIDFGTSAREGENIQAGHELFAAPEIIEGMVGKQVTADASVDLWAVAQIMYKYVNSLLHNSESTYLSDAATKQNSYSDRIGIIANLISRYKDLQTPVQPPRAIQSEHIAQSPIQHRINNFETFQAFNQNLAPIFDCLEGILNLNPQARINAEQALALLAERYTVDENMATTTLAALNENISVDAERLEKIRQKYRLDDN